MNSFLCEHSFCSYVSVKDFCESDRGQNLQPSLGANMFSSFKASVSKLDKTCGNRPKLNSSQTKLPRFYYCYITAAPEGNSLSGSLCLKDLDHVYLI